MTLQSKKYLDDILYAIELIEEFVSEINSYSEYSDDKKTCSAVERQLGIIGEAVNKFDKINPKERLENTAQIIGLRNRIIHAYDSINDAVIWAIIKKHLSALKEEVKIKLKQ
jgi:uncharacterized protein with HEPN domain